MAGAYTRQDVIDTLIDPVLDRIAISAEGLWITGEAFRSVLTNILFGNISVEEGTQTIALYYSGENKIVTQLGTSPPSVHSRALLLHECTHALFDIKKFKTTSLTNEVLCYIAQHLYLLFKLPNYSVSIQGGLDPVSQTALWQSFYASVLEYAKGGISRPLIIDTSHWEFQSLRNHLWSLNIYQHLQHATVSQGNG